MVEEPLSSVVSPTPVSMGRGAWWATVHGVAELDPTELIVVLIFRGFLGGSDGTESACNAGDLCSIPGWARSPGEGNGNPFQHSCLENPMDRGDGWTTVYGVTKSRRWLSNLHTYEWCSERNGVSLSWIFAKLLALWCISVWKPWNCKGVMENKTGQRGWAVTIVTTHPWSHILDPQILESLKASRFS